MKMSGGLRPLVTFGDNMAAIYRAVKDGEIAEEWEGIRFVSAIAEGEQLESMLRAGWADHPLKLTQKVRKNVVDKKAADRVGV